MKSKTGAEQTSVSKLGAKSSSAIHINTPNSQNRLTATRSISKDLSTLQLYNTIFGERNPYHIGDANTHFRKTLRKYNEFNGLKNIKWLQRRNKGKLVPKVSEKEHRCAAGDASGAFIQPRKKLEDTKVLLEELFTEDAEEDQEEELPESEDLEEKEVEEEKQVPEREDVQVKDMAEAETPAPEEAEGEAPEGDEPAEDMGKELQQTTEDFQKAVSEHEKEPGSGDSTTAVYPCVDNKVLCQLDDAEEQARSTAKIINDIKQRVTELLCRDHLSDKEAHELEEMNKQLMMHMANFEEKTKLIQMLVSVADQHLKPMPSIQPKPKEDILPKVVICGRTDNNMPKILICDSKKKRASSRSGERRRGPSPCPMPCQGPPCPPSTPCPPPCPPPPCMLPCPLQPCSMPCSPQPCPVPCPPCGVVPQMARRLSESYDMQEKLAADNIDLEGKRYRLQEELLCKDKAIECLQRQLCSMQAEMRMIVKENTTLAEHLEKMNIEKVKCRIHPDLPCGSGRGLCPADVENRLIHYQQATVTLEKQVEMMEEEVKRMQEELGNVRRERAEMECQRLLKLQTEVPTVSNSCACTDGSYDMKGRQMYPCPSSPCPSPPCGAPCAMPPCGMPCPPAPCGLPCPPPPCPGPPCMAEQQLRELREQYNRLQDDYKAKLVEVAGLRADNDNMKRTSAETDRLKRELELRFDDLERECKSHRNENSKLLGSKEMLIEQEQQLAVAKQRFREAQDELDELRACIQDQATQLDDYRNKYLTAQQQVEEQRRQIDVMEMENARISEQVTCEIQRVKGQFQERLAELAPLPDILKATQLKLQEEQQVRCVAERNVDALTRELQMYKDKLSCLIAQMEKQRCDQQMEDEEKVSLMTKMAGWECKCAELQAQCDKLKTELTKCEEQHYCYEKRLDEKAHEIVQLTAQLENVREESARQVTRTKERCETVRRSLQAQVAETERQLAQSRAAARAAQKDRDEIRLKMQAQITNLNDNFEEAQLRIRSLQGHVNFLKSSYTSMFGGADPTCPPSCPPPAADDESCNCTATY